MIELFPLLWDCFYAPVVNKDHTIENYPLISCFNEGSLGGLQRDHYLRLSVKKHHGAV